MKIHVVLILAVGFLTACFASETTPDPIPTHDSFVLKSRILNEDRTINIWIPDSAKNTSDSLPVLYMADGGIQEDFPHIANTLAELIRQKKIPPMILVGIENTDRKRDLTGPTTVKKDKKLLPTNGGSAQFRSFIQEELFAEIAKRYNTTDQRSIIGESLSGLFVMETLMLQPSMFQCYIAFDPSLWWNANQLVNDAETTFSKELSQPIRLWFAGSNATDIHTHTNALTKTLEKVDNSSLQWHYSPEPHEAHNTIFRATKEKALIWTFGTKD